MRRILAILFVLSIPVSGISAQTGERSVEVTGTELVHKGETVQVGFTLKAGKRAVKANYDLVVNPVVRSGATERPLTPIIIKGRRSRVADLRHELASGERDYRQVPVYMTQDAPLHYSATIPYEDWMSGGELVLNGVSVGCCSSKEVDMGVIAENILYAEPEYETTIVEIRDTIPGETTGEKMTRKYPFVASAKELEDKPYEEMIAAAKEGSVSIFFRQGSRTIDRYFDANNRNLVELIAAVRALTEAEDSRVVKIVIAGFTSPEGSTGLNEHLAWDRAMAVQDFLMTNTDIAPQTVAIYNGAVDWSGLRELVAASGLPQKYRIIDIIDNTPVWDSHRGVGGSSAKQSGS